MKILSWNIKWELQTRQENRLNKIVDGVEQISADIVGLQEADNNLLESFAPEFKALGYRVLSYEFYEKPYCNLILSKYPASKANRWKRDCDFPDLLSRARVRTPKGGEIEFFNCHIPNGSKHGFEKVRTIDALLKKLEATKGKARIVVGDFNEPFSESAEGIESWAYETRAKFSKDKKQRKEQKRHWDNTVNEVFKGEQLHGMRDVHGYKDGSFSYIRGSKTLCRYDHIFCSEHFKVSSCEYLDPFREEKVSDHSPLVTELGFLRRP